MTAQGQWRSYVRAAVDTAGGPTALARKAGINVATIHRWLRGASTAGRRSTVRRVALAIADDPNAALRAAGLPTEPSPAVPPAPAQVPPLADEIARVRALGERLGLPPEETIRAVNQLIEAYEQLPPPADPSEHRRPA